MKKEENNMKLKMVKVYQAVVLNRKPDTYFPNRNDLSATLELIPNVGVKVDGKEDSVIIPFPNVAFIQLEKETEKMATKKSKSIDE
jgi:hypothetical protein